LGLYNSLFLYCKCEWDYSDLSKCHVCWWWCAKMCVNIICSWVGVGDVGIWKEQVSFCIWVSKVRPVTTTEIFVLWWTFKKRSASMVCCTLFFECIDTLSLKVWQKISYSSCTAIYLNMCISHSVTQCCLHVWFASWIIVRFMAVVWLELFDFKNSKYSVCLICIVFMFSSNCSCVYSFGLQSHQFLKTISAQPLHKEVLILAISWQIVKSNVSVKGFLSNVSVGILKSRPAV
jgi:hypothetical protein